MFKKIVFALMLIFLACAVHFLGIYHFKIPSFRGNSNTTSATLGAFFSGVLSGITSASCVGPFAGVALAGAVLYNDGIEAFVILLALCAGVAMPYLLVAIFPNMIKHLPKPGAWLQTFQEIMGYAMLSSCVWIFSILLEQIGNYQNNIFAAIGCLNLLEILLNDEINPDCEKYLNIFKNLKIYEFNLF